MCHISKLQKMLHLYGKFGISLKGLHPLMIFVLIDAALAWYRHHSGNNATTSFSDAGM
jgi:hypothetical protein